jgi:hypothetical protein
MLFYDPVVLAGCGKMSADELRGFSEKTFLAWVTADRRTTPLWVAGFEAF